MAHSACHTYFCQLALARRRTEWKHPSCDTWPDRKCSIQRKDQRPLQLSILSIFSQLESSAIKLNVDDVSLLMSRLVCRYYLQQRHHHPLRRRLHQLFQRGRFGCEPGNQWIDRYEYGCQFQLDTKCSNWP